MTRLAALFLLAAACLPAAAAARADREEGVSLEHVRDVSGAPWLLSGTHVSRWAGLLKVSVGALWLPRDAPARDVLDAAVGKQLEIHYLADIPGERLRDGTRELLARNVSPQLLATEREGIAAIVDAFADVRRGDRYTLTYVPGEGVVLALNGRAVARSPRDGVAAAIFAVWLGPSPLDDAKKRALLSYRLHRQAPAVPAR